MSPLGTFFVGLRLIGVLVGVLDFVGTVWGGAGKSIASTEDSDSVDFPCFRWRVGAIFFCVFNLNQTQRAKYLSKEARELTENL